MINVETQSIETITMPTTYKAYCTALNTTKCGMINLMSLYQGLAIVTGDYKKKDMKGGIKIKNPHYCEWGWQRPGIAFLNNCIVVQTLITPQLGFIVSDREESFEEQIPNIIPTTVNAERLPNVAQFITADEYFDLRKRINYGQNGYLGLFR